MIGHLTHSFNHLFVWFVFDFAPRRICLVSQFLASIGFDAPDSFDGI